MSSIVTSLPALPRRVHVVIGVLGILFLLSVIREVTDANDLTSSGTAGAALRLAVPIGLAGLGGLYSERSGVVNIGLEGMMILGTWFGAYGAWMWGPWWGVLLGVLGGTFGALIHAVATIWFGVDHIISGVAVNILGAGIARYLSVIAYDEDSGGGPTQSPSGDNTIQRITVPILSGAKIGNWKSPDVLGTIEKTHWLFVSDAAGILRGLTRAVSLVTVIAMLLIPISTWVLWRTKFGLRLRSCGENPYAAESLGVNVYRMKLYGVLISGALAGLAGAFLSIIAASIYREGQTAGRGFIGLATLIFGNYIPGGVAAGAALFGFADALQLRDERSVRSLLLFVAVLLVAFAIRNLIRKRFTAAALSGVGAAGFAIWFAMAETVPSQITYCTPYAVTLLVLASASQRLRVPKADGLPYRRGQAS